MERRRDERIPTDFVVTCRMPALPCRATIYDVSRGGCRIGVSDGRFELGGTAMIELPAVTAVAGQIVWTDRDQAGVRFARPLVGRAAVTLGLEEPAAPPEPERPERHAEGGLGGLLRHWMRRLGHPSLS